jgi:uncharacterized protein (TIGR02118 family)
MRYVMTRLITALVKRDDLSHEEFVDHWMEEHVPIARRLPGLQRYSTVVADDPEESEYDGIAILDFESPEALEAAFDSEPGEMAVDDLDNFVEELTRTVGEETVHVE